MGHHVFGPVSLSLCGIYFKMNGLIKKEVVVEAASS
jgi:hypothetical protein